MKQPDLSSTLTKGVKSMPSLLQALLRRFTLFLFAGNFAAQVSLLAA